LTIQVLSDLVDKIGRIGKYCNEIKAIF